MTLENYLPLHFVVESNGCRTACGASGSLAARITDTLAVTLLFCVR
jgi:hypothetical protein